MNREAFFAGVRARPFKGHLSQEQVDGMSVLLDVWRELYPQADARFIANSLAQIHRETGGRMQPVREAFADSDTQAIARLDSAWRKGRLSWVREPYWRDGWFGRGHIQITHQRNYERLGQRLGIDLVANRDLALDPVTSAKIAIVGMVEGLFTGLKLSQFFNAEEDKPGPARRIVNGPDGTDDLIARMHHDFLAALTAAGYAPAAVPAPETAPAPLPEPAPAPVPEPAPEPGWRARLVSAWRRLIARLTAFVGR